MKLFFITVKENLDEFFFANKLRCFILQLSLFLKLTVAIVHTCVFFFKLRAIKKALHASGSIVTQYLSYLRTYSAGIYRRAVGSFLNSILLLCSGCCFIRSV